MLIENAPNIFPNFKSLDITDHQTMEVFARQFDPYSDFCFSTLMFYDSGNHTSWCWLNGNLVLRMQDSYGPGTYLTFLGNEKAHTTATKLMSYCRCMNYSPVLWRVPKITAQAIMCEGDGFNIEEDRSGFDYIYLTDALARLEGPSYYPLRKSVHKFERQYPHHSFVTLDLSEATTYTQLRLVIGSWQSNNAGTCLSALERCLCNANHFDLTCYGMIIDGTLVGCLIYEKIRKNCLMGHFSVINSNFTSVYSRLVQYSAQCSLKLGYTHFNHQEDLGNLGLRNFKMKYIPSDFLQKFSVREQMNH